jgi:hypothetical protein
VEGHTAPVQEMGQARATRGGGLLQDADLPPPEEMCSICHDEFTMPCQANCSHWFCGESGRFLVFLNDCIRLLRHFLNGLTRVLRYL